MLKGWTNLIYFLTNVLFKAKFGSTARTSMLAEEIQRDAEMSDRNYVFSCTGNCIPTFVVGGCIFRCVFVSGRNYGCLHQIFLQLWLQFAKLSVQVTLHHCCGILSLIWTIVGFLPPFSWARSFYWFVSQFGQEGILAQNDNDHHGENNDCVILMMMPSLYNLLRNLIRSLDKIGQ